MVEALCRIVGPPPPPAADGTVSKWHTAPDGQTFWVVRGEGFNDDGMRDREHDLNASPGVHRIVCLGDSVTAGRGVKKTEAYPFYLESFLSQLGLSVEVFNIAASGWSTRQEATAYTQIARKYKPNHVFLGVCLNDIAEMHNNLTAPPPAIVSSLMRHSALIRTLIGAEQRQAASVRQVFDDPGHPAVRDGWEKVFEDLLRLQRETQQDRCDLSVVVFPFRFQLETDPPPPVAQKKMCEFSRRHGIPCLDLRDALTPLGPKAMIDDSHLSPLGTKRVAEELIRWGRSGCVMCGLELIGVEAAECPRCGTTIER
jgi:lysophospholipase L1-like esterase